jgi:hypothetical protein
MIAKHGLTVVLEDILRRPSARASLVTDRDGRRLLLKPRKLGTPEIELLQTAKRLENELCFRVPELVDFDEEMLLSAYVDLPLLSTHYDDRADWCMRLSMDIARDYQQVLGAHDFGDPAVEGAKWMREKLAEWYRSLLEAGMGSEAERDALAANLLAAEAAGTLGYGWTHGNIIGEHVRTDLQGKPYLFEPDAKPRYGQVWERLRAIDFYLLEAHDPALAAANALRWIEAFIPATQRQAAYIVFGLRCLGICWDLLKQGTRPSMPRREEKIAMLRSFISRAAGG